MTETRGGPGSWPEARPLPWRVLARLDMDTGFSQLLSDTRDAILLYHAVGEAADVGYRWVVAPSVFRAQLDLLSHRFEFVDLGEIVATPSNDTKRLAITFDDGFRSVKTAAIKVLEEFDAPATVFVSPDLIGQRPQGDLAEIHGLDRIPRDLLLSWDDLQELAASSLITIGNHTASHPNLKAVTDRTELVDEIDGAREELEKRLPVTIDRFSYPYGTRTDAAASIVRRSHEIAVTSRPDLVSSSSIPHRLPRLDACRPPHVLLFETSSVSNRLRQLTRRRGP